MDMPWYQRTWAAVYEARRRICYGGVFLLLRGHWVRKLHLLAILLGISSQLLWAYLVFLSKGSLKLGVWWDERRDGGVFTPFNSLTLETWTASNAFVAASTAAMINVFTGEHQSWSFRGFMLTLEELTWDWLKALFGLKCDSKFWGWGCWWGWHACIPKIQGTKNKCQLRDSFKEPGHPIQQNVPHVSFTYCWADSALYIYQCIQSKTSVAPRFYQAIHETAIQTRTEIQKEDEVKMGKTEMGKGCQAGADG